MVLCNIFALVLYSLTVLDSSFLVIDATYQSVSEIELEEQIIDHIWADYLYLVTTKDLYKIDTSGPNLIDKTPLPMRFNYLMLKGNDIILIATNEVIVLDRHNLSFKSGVGLEYGDHKPLVKDQSFATIPANDYIYLASDAGAQSIVRIIDLRSGRLLKRIRTDSIKSFHYDVRNKAFVALDVKNNIQIFDPRMNRKHTIKLQMPANSLSIHTDGFLIHADQGVLLVDVKGKVIDFQPIPQVFKRCGLLVLSSAAIVGFDSTTLRPDGWLMNKQNIVELHACVDSYQGIGTDPQNNHYLIEHTPIRITPLSLTKMHLEWAVQPLAKSDSLWYLQLGAFANPANALEEHAEFRQKGLPVFIDSTDLYCVKLGGFSDKHAGLDIADKANLQGWFVYERTLPNKQRDAFYVGDEKYVIQDGVIRKEEP